MSFDSVLKHNKRYTKGTNLSVLEPLVARGKPHDKANRVQNGAVEGEKQGREHCYLRSDDIADRHSTMLEPNSTKNNNDTTNQIDESSMWMHDEDATEMAGKNREENVQEEHEFLVKWQMPKEYTTIDAKKQMMKLLAILMVNFPDVTFIDHKQREWSFTAKDEEERFCKELEAAAIQMHSIKTKQMRIARWVTITKIRATTNIPDWKNNDFFCDELIEAKIYMIPHPFAYDEWEITSIGFIKDIHAVHFPPGHLHQLLSEYIQAQDNNPPTFQLIPQKIKNKDNDATTRAYTVQCPRANVKRMSELLTHGEFRNNHMFIPFKYKYNKPELFTKCIKQQNEVYYKTWIIKLEGITKEIMHFIMDEITKLNGVFHVVPTKRLINIGEWKVLVDQTRSSYIHRQLTNEWQRIIANVPKNFLDQAPPSWPTPQISSKRIRDYQDDSSDIDSYGSLLTSGTNDSTMTYGDDNLNELPADYQYLSYAAAVKAPTHVIDATRMSSPTASDLTEWQKEKSDLEAQLQKQAAIIEKFQEDQARMIQNLQLAQAQQIADLKAEQARQMEKLQIEIQTDIQARVSRIPDLENNLAQAIELAYNRHSREDEMLQKFELLMTRFSQEKASTPQEQQQSQAMVVIPEKLHTTPPRSNTSKESPPTKKANTNTSPQRQPYQIFRPQASKPQNPNSRRHGINGHPQPMESDDEPSRPTPMANLGKKLE
jgi:hypothetical protein